MADLKISQFTDGGSVQATDEIATNRAGVNTKVFVGSAASLDAGLGVGDVLTWQDDGSGNPQYPGGNGSQLTDISVSSESVTYDPSSSAVTTASATNVFEAIDLLDFAFQSISVNAENVTFTPYGDIAANNVQDAIEELDDEKATAAQGALAETAIQRDETVVTANTGTSYAINYATAQNFALTLTGNCTFTFTNPPSAGGAINVRLIQDGTGSRTATWPAAVNWAGGVAPDLTGTAGSIDVFTFVTFDGGTTWQGFLAGDNMS